MRQARPCATSVDDFRPPCVMGSLAVVPSIGFIRLYG